MPLFRMQRLGGFPLNGPKSRRRVCRQRVASQHNEFHNRSTQEFERGLMLSRFLEGDESSLGHGHALRLEERERRPL